MVDPNSSARPSLFHTRRQPPPDYFSRRVQVRVLVLVFLLLAVMKLMDLTRQPANWKWMWQFEKRTSQNEAPAQPAAPAPSARPSIDTRPTPQPATEAPAQPVVTSPTNRLTSQDLLRGPVEESLHAALLRGWGEVLHRLEPSQRDLFQQGMWNHRHQRGLTSDERAGWLVLRPALHQQWALHQARMRQAVEQDQDQLTETQRRLCDDVLVALESHWQRHIAAVDGISEEVSGSDEQAAALAELQQVLDQRGWQAVEDNTVLRVAENDAWYRSWELLESSQAEGAEGEATPVSFVQLFSQPDAYRGRPVRIEGTARLGYHVVSRTGRFGIDSYDVLWIRPADGTDAPIAAYVRALPAGFPPLAERVPHQDGTPLREEVTVTGLFFKRWLYGSRGGPNLAPLVLGEVTQWTPRTAATAEGQVEWAGGWTPVALALAAAGMGLACAAWVYRRSRRYGQDVLPATRMPDELPSFDVGSVQPSVEESLRHLNREDEDA